MSINASNWAWGLQDVTSTEKLILLSFADRAGESHEAWPSKKRLELDTCLCFNSIDKGIKSLVKKGYMIKTGETKNQVPVYKLIGVTSREGVQNKNKNQTPPPKKTPPKNGVSTPPKYAPPTPPKYGIQNHQLNPQRNPKAQQAADSIFLPIKNIIEELAQSTGTGLTEDLTSQVEFYAEKFKDRQPEEQSVKVALSLIRNKKWKIPNGYKGITSQSIKTEEDNHHRDKMIQADKDAKIMRNIKSTIMEESFKSMKQSLA